MTQRHIIKRQIIEVEAPTTQESERLASTLGRIYRQRIVAMIDKICSELSTPETLHRIDSLVVDLGRLHPQHFEDGLLGRVEAALYESIQTAIQEAEQHADTTRATDKQQSLRSQSQLELLVIFLQSGTVTWWADAAKPTLIAEAIENLLVGAPRVLSRHLRALLQQDTPRLRLIHHLDDTDLYRILQLLSPRLTDDSDRRLLLEIMHLLQHTQSWNRQRARRIVWQQALQIAIIKANTLLDRRHFYQHMIQSIAAHTQKLQSSSKQSLQVAYTELLRQLVARATAESDTQNFLNTLLEDTDGDSQSTQASIQVILSELEGQFAALVREGATQTRLQAILSQLDALSDLSYAAIPVTSWQQWLVLLREMNTGQLSSTLHKLHTQIMEQLEAGMRQQADEAPADEAPADEIDLTFSDADEVYVHNAGLVILWQFLVPLLTNVGYVRERQFTDTFAQYRAAALLQYVATAQDEMIEYMLPLNKILCGLLPTAPFVMDEPLTGEEKTEADNLLAAVIAQVSVLNNMSLDGFRGTFLLRQGVLSAGVGTWRLRVERETYDVVLERFPWGWSNIKLPWMQDMVQVEW